MIDRFGLLLLGLGFGLVVSIGLLIRLTSALPGETIQLLFGERSVLETGLSFGTFVGAIVTVFFLIKRSRHDDRTIELTQFKEAASLLGSSSLASNLSGMFALSELAKLNAKGYARVAAQTIFAYGTEKSSSEWEGYWEYNRGKADDFTLKRSIPAVRRAFTTVGSVRLAGQRGWPRMTDDTMPMALSNYALHEVAFERLNLSDTELTNLVTGDVTFINCDLRGAYLHILAFSR